LDGDYKCEYLARIDSDDNTQPPGAGTWSLQCSYHSWTQHDLSFLPADGAWDPFASTKVPPKTTTKTTTKAVRTTTKAPGATKAPGSSAEDGEWPPKMLYLTGACAYKQALNGLTFVLQAPGMSRRPS
jgi:hypothetical protein